MVVNKKKIAIIIGVLFFFGFLFLSNYYASTTHYGTIKIRELEQWY